MSTGIELIAAERQRQIEVERFDVINDNGYENDDLAVAAAIYALPDFNRQRVTARHPVPFLWPFADEWWKPTPNDRIRELVKAGALLAAEIDRLQNIQK
jgi:hypothetical protein